MHLYSENQLPYCFTTSLNLVSLCECYFLVLQVDLFANSLFSSYYFAGIKFCSNCEINVIHNVSNYSQVVLMSSSQFPIICEYRDSFAEIAEIKYSRKYVTLKLRYFHLVMPRGVAARGILVHKGGVSI